MRDHVVQVPRDRQPLVAGPPRRGLSFTAAHGYRLVIGAGTLADWGIGRVVGTALLGAARPYLPYTAATSLAGTPLGEAGFSPARGVAPLPFAGATALLVAIALAGAVAAAHTTVRRDIT